MLRRYLVMLFLGALTLAACQTTSVAPAPAVPTPLPLNNPAGQSQAPAAQPAAPNAPAQAPTAQAPAAGQLQPIVPTPPPSFLEGSEKARGEIPAAPKAPGAAQEVKPTTEPSPVKASGPTTTAKDRLLYVRGGRLWTAGADGKDQKLLLDDKAPQLWSPPKDPGRAWVSPSGKTVAYYGGGTGALYVVNSDGTNNRQVLPRSVPDPAAIGDKEADKVGRKLMEQEPAWSPDESQLAILAAPQGQIDLYLVNLKTSQATQLNNDSASHGEMVWSPKGDMLAFKSRDDNGNIEKAFVLRDGKLTAIPTEQIAKLASETDLGGVLTLTWLDDQRLFFYPVSSALQSLGIWTYNTADGSLKPVYNKALTTPDYQSKTQQWVFSSTDGKNTLYVLDLNSAEPKTVVPQSALAPIWVPDGKRIIYSVDNGETYDIHIVNTDGSNDKTLATAVNFIGDNPPEPSPAGKRYFTPDGQRLVYAMVGADYGSTGNNLENWWTVPLDGSQPATPVTDIPRIFYIRQLSYSPDKQSWAFTGLRYADRATHLWTFSPSGGNIVKVDAEVRWFRWLGPLTSAKGN